MLGRYGVLVLQRIWSDSCSRDLAHLSESSIHQVGQSHDVQSFAKSPKNDLKIGPENDYDGFNIMSVMPLFVIQAEPSISLDRVQNSG